MGHLVEEKEVVIHEDHCLTIPDPGLDGEDEHAWPVRGTFSFADRTWTVVRDDDPTFWGFREGGISRTKAEMLEDLDFDNRTFMEMGRINQWWDLDERANPQQLAIKVSIAEMALENKILMAHLMVDLKFFTSVSQAKKNGWDKPLTLGRHELGPKKKRAFVEIIP